MQEKYGQFEDEAIFYYMKSMYHYLAPVDFFVQLINELRTTYKRIYPQQIELFLRKIGGCNTYVYAVPLTLREKVNFVALLPQTQDKEYSNMLSYARAPDIKVFESFIQSNYGYRNYQHNFEALADTGLVRHREGSMLLLGRNAHLN